MKSGRLNSILVFLVILYVTELINFLHSEIAIYAIELLIYALGMVSAFNYYLNPLKKKTVVSYLILAFSFLVPLFCSVRALQVFGQPMLNGVGHMRYMIKLMFAFYICVSCMSVDKVMKQINAVNISIAVVSFILLYFFRIDMAYLTEEKIFFLPYELDNDVVQDMVKGAKLTLCSDLMIVSLVYYLISALSKRKAKDIIILCILSVYILFVHKGRQMPVALTVLVVVYLLRNINLKNILISVAILSVITALIIHDTNIASRYDEILSGDYSNDASVLQRLKDIEYVTPYIADHPVAGVGCLAPSYNDGFMGIFDQWFFISDIGLLGTMTEGGIILVLCWLLFYFISFKESFRLKDRDQGMFIRGMIIVLTVLAFIGSDLLMNSPAIIAFILYPLLEGGAKKFERRSSLGFRS